MIECVGFVQESTRWANHHLGVAGYSDHLITDLSTDLADGITLLRLVQSLCKYTPQLHTLTPLTPAHIHTHSGGLTP